MKRAIIFFSVVASLFMFGSFALAQTYTPLAPLPGTINPTTGTTDIATYVGGAIKLIIALGAALAILYAVIGGTQYVAASINPSLKSDALERIQGALIGLAIILTSYLLLNSINPDLVNFKLTLPSIGTSPMQAPAGAGSVVAGGAHVPLKSGATSTAVMATTTPFVWKTVSSSTIAGMHRFKIKLMRALIGITTILLFQIV